MYGAACVASFFLYLTQEEIQQLADVHYSAPPLKAISDYDLKLVQRLLYYTASDLWLSEKDKDWHFFSSSLSARKTEIIGGTGVLRLGRTDGKIIETGEKKKERSK